MEDGWTVARNLKGDQPALVHYQPVAASHHLFVEANAHAIASPPQRAPAPRLEGEMTALDGDQDWTVRARQRQPSIASERHLRQYQLRGAHPDVRGQVTGKRLAVHTGRQDADGRCTTWRARHGECDDEGPGVSRAGVGHGQACTRGDK